MYTCMCPPLEPCRGAGRPPEPKGGLGLEPKWLRTKYIIYIYIYIYPEVHPFLF